MNNLIQITTAIILLIHTMGYAQESTTEVISEEQQTTTQDLTQNDEKFIGTYLLEEGAFELEIMKENDKMYIVTEFSKDVLLQKNATTLHEITRGVDLELIPDNDNALKFSQNGYVTTIKRVKKESEE